MTFDEVRQQVIDSGVMTDPKISAVKRRAVAALMQYAAGIDPAGKHAAPPPVECLSHVPIQHRDGKPPWCRNCGLTADYETPVSGLSEGSGAGVR